jgi:DUF917 family protein
MYLLDNDFLIGDAAIEALGWAEDMQLDLKLKAEELEATAPGQDEVMKSKLIALMEEVVLLLKIVLAFLLFLCVLVALKK